MRRHTSIALTALLLTTVAPALAQSPPPGAVPPATAGLSFAPLKGQTGEQLWSDRYACHDWAKGQSGYDPTPHPGSAATGNPGGLEQYRRAMSACMEGKGYRVQSAEAAPAPPAPVVAPAPSAPAAPAPAPVWVHQSEPLDLRYHPLTAQIEGGPAVTTGDTQHALRDGWNVGLGLTWFPVSTLPLGVRVDGTYGRFGESWRSLDNEAAATGANVLYGHEDVYGGDADLQLNLPMTPQVRAYLLGGIGWYREQTYFRQFITTGVTCGYLCGPFGPGYTGYSATLENSTSDWQHSWNAGAGFEFALADPATLFVEARFLRITSAGSRGEFIPVRVGVRF